jgi:hypothetical protein
MHHMPQNNKIKRNNKNYTRKKSSGTGTNSLKSLVNNTGFTQDFQNSL